MIRVELIRGKMAEKGYTQENVAEYLNMSLPTFRARMKAKRFWTDELENLALLFDVSDIGFFFSTKLECGEQ